MLIFGVVRARCAISTNTWPMTKGSNNILASAGLSGVFPATNWVISGRRRAICCRSQCKYYVGASFGRSRPRNIDSTSSNPPTSQFTSFADFSGTDTNWMQKSDTTAYLSGILLSYRLLFGQDKASRKAFREHGRRSLVNGGPSDTIDPLLDSLCGRKIFQDAMLMERETYRLHRDFLFLRSRLVTLKKELAMAKPRPWRELWRDKRDTSSWYTFWAVIWIDGAGLIFAAVQTALAAAQLAAARGGKS
jgi:hypothetical protein